MPDIRTTTHTCSSGGPARRPVRFHGEHPGEPLEVPKIPLPVARLPGSVGFNSPFTTTVSRCDPQPPATPGSRTDPAIRTVRGSGRQTTTKWPLETSTDIHR